jgi:histidinol-phosphate aminotransferase
MSTDWVDESTEAPIAAFYFPHPEATIGTQKAAGSLWQTTRRLGHIVHDMFREMRGFRTAGFQDRLVPAARTLSPNAEYLKHLELSGGDRLIRLASNENTDHPSPEVARALARAFDDANLSPPPVPPLVGELARRHRVDLDQVLVTAGSTEVIDATLRTFVRAGDEVVVPAPSWPVCRRRLQALEADIVEIPLHCGENSWDYDAGAFLDAITPATKLIFICTPNNPTGNSMSLAGLRQLADTGLPVLIDAAYYDFDPHAGVIALAREHENVIVTRTFSKAYCLAGLRVGYALGGAEILGYVERLLVPGSAVSSASLHAAMAALLDDAYHERQTTRIVAERTRLSAALRELGVHVWESGGNFVAVDARRSPGRAEGVADAILEHGIVVRPFGDVLRISIGVEHENDAVIAAMTRIVGGQGTH